MWWVHRPGESAIPGPYLSLPWQAKGKRPRPNIIVSNDDNCRLDFLTNRRTDTTLDLSQEAEKSTSLQQTPHNLYPASPQKTCGGLREAQQPDGRRRGTTAARSLAQPQLRSQAGGAAKPRLSGNQPRRSRCRARGSAANKQHAGAPAWLPGLQEPGKVQEDRAQVGQRRGEIDEAPWAPSGSVALPGAPVGCQ